MATMSLNIIKALNESAMSKNTKDIVTNEELNNWVYFKVGDTDPEYVECKWSDNQDVYDNDIEDGESIDDYWALYYNIYDKDGNESDGGECIIREDTPYITYKELICDYIGYRNDMSITRISEEDMPNQDNKKD